MPMKQGKSSYLHYVISQGEAKLHTQKLILVFNHLPSVIPKQLCVLAYLGRTLVGIYVLKYCDIMKIYKTLPTLNPSKDRMLQDAQNIWTTDISNNDFKGFSFFQSCRYHYSVRHCIRLYFTWSEKS